MSVISYHGRMTQDIPNPDLLARIEKWCADNNVGESTFGRIAVNDGSLVSGMRNGRELMRKTRLRVEALLDSTPNKE